MAEIDFTRKELRTYKKFEKIDNYLSKNIHLTSLTSNMHKLP